MPTGRSPTGEAIGGELKKEAHMLIDTTLREGLQAFDVYLDPQERAELASRIASAGITELEIGWAGRGSDLKEVVAAVERARARPLVWSMARRVSLEEAAHSGASAVTICIPASRRHQSERFGLDLTAVEEWIQETVAQAKSLFDFVQVGFEDASRADRTVLADLLKTAELAGANRVRVADTVGLLSPLEVARMVSRVHSATKLPIGVHLHDDLGMATAGAITAIESGAATADTTLLGIGERAGISATEEIAAWGVLRRGMDIDLRALRDACEWLARKTGIVIPGSKAVAGGNIFSTGTGIHVDAIGRNPSLYEPWDPVRTGHERASVLGANSGKGAVRLKLQELGLPEPSDLEDLVDEIRHEGARLRRPLRDEELPRFFERPVG